MTPLARRYRSQADHALERQVSAMLTPAEMAQLTGDLEAARPALREEEPGDEPSGAVFWMIGAWVVSLLILAGTDIWEKML
jgi:hypothetical protein